MEETILFLKSLLKNNDTVIVGTSGGADSMCLLSLLVNLKNEFNLNIICAHINHNLRSESQKEYELVKKYCEDNNITLEYKILEYQNEKFTESIGRKKRYEFFEELIKKYNAQYLMTAHHGDDLTETILMRITRGSNLKGYIGIKQIKNKIVRPLLNLSKEEIYEYVKNNKIPYLEDVSNNNEKYTRNRFRKHMLPFLKNEDKLVHLKFLKFSKELEKYDNYINKVIYNKIDKIYKNGKIKIDELLKEEEFIQEKIIEYVIEEIQKKDILDISDKQFNEILKLLKNKDNKQINLNNNYIARKSYNYLIIEKNKKELAYEYELDKEVNILDKYIIEKVADSKLKNNFITRLNSQEITLPLKVRNIRLGDKMQIKNLSGSKKIKDILIDLKIDKGKRKEIPVVLDSKNVILWLPGLKKSIFDKEINEKYDIILKYTEVEDE